MISIILDDKGKKHFEKIVTRHGTEPLWQCRYEKKVEEKLRMGGRKELWIVMELRWERWGCITIFSLGVGIPYEKKSSSSEKQIKDDKKWKGTKISVTTNMKGSRMILLTWQIDLSKLEKREIMERTEELVKLEVTVKEERSSEGKE